MLPKVVEAEAGTEDEGGREGRMKASTSTWANPRQLKNRRTRILPRTPPGLPCWWCCPGLLLLLPLLLLLQRLLLLLQLVMMGGRSVPCGVWCVICSVCCEGKEGER